jgi:hypothetical protein
MLPTDDMKSWAFRMAHLGILGAIGALAIIVLLLLFNGYLIYSVSRLRMEVRSLSTRIKRLSENTVQGAE